MPTQGFGLVNRSGETLLDIGDGQRVRVQGRRRRWVVNPGGWEVAKVAKGLTWRSRALAARAADMLNG